MGVILNFPIERVLVRRATVPPLSATGLVIILPVVRIERDPNQWDCLPPDAKAPARAPGRGGSQRSPRGSKPAATP